MEEMNSVDKIKQFYYNSSNQFKNNNEIENEFLKIFYKSLLKETFKGFDVTENKSFFSTFTKDIMVDKFAEELAKKTDTNYLKEGKSDK